MCNSTLYHRPDLLMGLPDEELHGYVKKCFKGMAMEYVTNSLYPICIAGALRIFKREQFLFLRFEDLMRMKVRGAHRTLLAPDLHTVCAGLGREVAHPTRSGAAKCSEVVAWTHVSCLR